MTMKDEFWTVKNEGNITIKLNDLCNTNCLHCFSSGLDRSFLDFSQIRGAFSELLFELFNKSVRRYDISFVGGEITLISEDNLRKIVDGFNLSILDFLENIYKNNNSKEKVEFSICFISNFIFDIKKTNYSSLLYSFTQVAWDNKDFNPYAEMTTFSIDVFTSFDYGLERFKSTKVEALWRKKCSEYAGPLGLLVTLNKETCENILKIEEDDFFTIFNQIIFQIMLDFGDKSYLAPDYELLYKTVNYIRSKCNEKPYLLSTKTATKYYVSINNDSVLSCCVSEEVKLYDNKEHFHLSEINKNKEVLLSSLDKQLNLRKKKSQNKRCLSCEHFEDCNFGMEVFDYGIICPAFKIEP